MRLLYTSDLHGHTQRYQELSRLIIKHSPDLNILGGDLLPHGHSHNGVQNQIQFIDSEFIPFLAGIPDNIPMGLILGNDDSAGCLPRLRELKKTFPIELIAENPMDHDAWQILGYQFLPPTPFMTKDFDKLDRRSDPLPTHPQKSLITENRQLIEIETTQLFQQRSSIEEDLDSIKTMMESTIFISHAPPFGCSLDRLHNGQSVGSRAIRKWIEENQPLITLHGHIHESPQVSGKYCDMIGNTICINPGQVESSLSAVIVDIGESITIEHTVYGPFNKS